MAFQKKSVAQEDKGTIVLRARFGNKQAVDKIMAVPDKNTGRLYTGQGKNGLGFTSKKEEEENEDGIIIDNKTIIAVSDGYRFNLNDPVQAALWRMAQVHPYIAMEKKDLGSQPDARFYVEDLQSEAENVVKVQSTVTTVKYKILNEINHDKRKALSKVLGLESADGFNENQLLQYLLQMVEVPSNATVAEAFLKPENSAMNEALVMVRDLKTVGLVEKFQDSMHRYGGLKGTPLGLDEKDVAEYLIDPSNKDFVFSIHTTLEAIKQERNLS
jgi:hypothetical protein